MRVASRSRAQHSFGTQFTLSSGAGKAYDFLVAPSVISHENGPVLRTFQSPFHLALRCLRLLQNPLRVHCTCFGIGRNMQGARRMDLL
jgi:hypothetical protein